MNISEAADILLDMCSLVDEFYDSQFTKPRRAIVMRQLSALAGYCRAVRGQRYMHGGTVLQAATFSQHFAAGVWLHAHIADALREANRIADNMLRLPEADSDNA